MTLCNMVVEAGGKNGVIAADQVTFNYLEVRVINECPVDDSHCWGLY
jgi:homoaconitase/3-isopropylmalate dehydratase large subunit